MLINHNDRHMVGSTVCRISWGPPPTGVGPGAWLCCEQEGCSCGSGLVQLFSVEGKGFREPQKCADSCQSQHSPGQRGGARVGVGMEDQINGRGDVGRQQPGTAGCNNVPLRHQGPGKLKSPVGGWKGACEATWGSRHCQAS